MHPPSLISHEQTMRNANLIMDQTDFMGWMLYSHIDYSRAEPIAHVQCLDNELTVWVQFPGSWPEYVRNWHRKETP